MTTLAITSDQSFWSDKQISALKALGLANASNGDLAFFFHQAQRTGLDPFARQIYMIERGGRYGIQTSIDGLRIIAQRSGEYAGQAGPYWCGDDGQWTDVWLKPTPPTAAKVGVYRAGFSDALWAVAKWDSYAQNSPIWKKMPDLMLAKCAESLALRKAFPNDMSGLYTDEEMGQADTHVVEPKIKPQKVELKAVEQLEPIVVINWEEVLGDVDNANTLPELKEVWNKYTTFLDSIIPNTQESLRTVLFDKVKEAQSNA